MENQPLFSVLIANYNNGKYLMEAIESVRQQTYTNWEIILVDDGSTDNSQELYKELEKDNRIHIFYNEKNMGCGYTKARCADLSTGEICGFLDPDDALLPDALRKHAEAHVEHPNVSIVYSKAHYCDTDFNIIGDAKLPNFSKEETYLNYRCYGAMNLASYKNSAYKKTKGINKNAKAGVDQELYFLVEEVGDIFALDEFTYNYVISGHPNAITHGTGRKYANLWYWNLVVRYQAMKRRGWNADELIVGDLQKVIEDYAQDRIAEEQIRVRSSHAYRLGKALLRPFSWIKRKIL